MLLLERGTLGGGTTAQSSCIVRTHYSVRENVALAQRRAATSSPTSPRYLDDAEADCGFTRCGLHDRRAATARAPTALSRDARRRARARASTRARSAPTTRGACMPLLHARRHRAIGWEPDAGYADAYLTLTAFARNARRLGVDVREGVAVTGLVRDAAGARHRRETTAQGDIDGGRRRSARRTSGPASSRAGPASTCRSTLSRHAVFTLEAPMPYTRDLPVLKDLASAGKLYLRSYGGRAAAGRRRQRRRDDRRARHRAGRRAARLRRRRSARRSRTGCRRSRNAGLAASWTGVYDVTPDWNPVLGAAARRRRACWSPTAFPATASSCRRSSAGWSRRRRSACATGPAARAVRARRASPPGVC